MQTHTFNTYTIGEHPDPNACIEWVRIHWDDLYSWESENVESLNSFCDCFDLSRPDFEISLSSHSYATAKIEDENIANLRGVRLWVYINNNILNYHPDVLKGNCPFTGYCFDEILLDPIRAFIKKPFDISYQDLIDECLNAWVKEYINDWTASKTDEYIREFCEANEYQFRLSGEVF